MENKAAERTRKRETGARGDRTDGRRGMGLADRLRELADEAEAMEARLMPDGLSWPIVDGQPVDFVTGYEPSLGVLEAVSIYSNGACEVMSHDGIIKGVKEIHVEKPKVLDADGVEIHVGDTVCGTRDMEPMRVVDADSRECGFKHIKCEKDGDGFFFYCADELTHKLPVLAADGRPLRERETVWDVESGTEYEVVGIHADEDSPVRVMRTDGTHLAKATKPSQLTHTKPEIDTWERLEEDAGKDPCSYFGFDGEETCGKCPASEKNCEQTMALDLVRRCRALAERERGE